MFIIIVLILVLLLATITDLNTKRIPNYLTYSTIIFGAIYNIIVNFNYFIIAFITAIFITIFGNMLYKLGMGGGDIKLFIAINMLLPIYYNHIFILYVMVLSSMICLLYIKSNKLKNMIFAPFIFIATIFCLILLPLL